jgi:NAD(P)H dehydrogenase (quinone)
MIQGAVAVKEARFENIVSLTRWLASPSHPTLMTRQHWLVDRLFR